MHPLRRLPALLNGGGVGRGGDRGARRLEKGGERGRAGERYSAAEAEVLGGFRQVSKTVYRHPRVRDTTTTRFDCCAFTRNTPSTRAQQGTAAKHKHTARSTALFTQQEAQRTKHTTYKYNTQNAPPSQYWPPPQTHTQTTNPCSCCLPQPPPPRPRPPLRMRWRPIAMRAACG
ncbi:hypothetical protein B484DRAFT_445915 [Ochromonadaceae sp. CCMP2298]|nr:hypothetical protein B484DRAFT_445915 [Ochromonadaceae sp. CCMP2298]